jgi:hypothetical protein
LGQRGILGGDGVKVGDVVRLWRLEQDFTTRTPTDRIGVVLGFHPFPNDVIVFMDGKRDRYHPNALRVISAARGH